MERGPVSLLRIIDELLERKVAAPFYKNEINGRGGSAALTTQYPLPAEVGTIFAGRGGRSVGIVRLRNKSNGICFGRSGSCFALCRLEYLT
jgi:hypothetical protein